MLFVTGAFYLQLINLIGMKLFYAVYFICPKKITAFGGGNIMMTKPSLYSRAGSKYKE